MWDVEQLPMKKELISRGQTDIYARIQCKTKNICTLFYKKIHIIQKF